MASTGAGSPSDTYLKLLNAVATTKFKLVGPYPASNDAMLAMERGEVDGAFTSYNTLKCGVCHSDLLTVQGLMPGIQYPRVPGHEVIGTVAAIGDNVRGWQVGSRAKRSSSSAAARASVWRLPARLGQKGLRWSSAAGIR